MYAKWISEDVYDYTHDIKGFKLIKKGDIRKIHAKKDDLYILEGQNGVGYYGWVEEKDIEIFE